MKTRLVNFNGMLCETLSPETVLWYETNLAMIVYFMTMTLLLITLISLSITMFSELIKTVINHDFEFDLNLQVNVKLDDRHYVFAACVFCGIMAWIGYQ